MKERNGILIPDKKLIYWYVPKCACTSLKAFFARYMQLEFEDPHAAPFEYIAPAQADEYHAQGWQSFAVVRHPLDRLVSLYRDKIRPGYRGWGFPQGVEEFVFGSRPGFYEDMTFREFVTLCLDEPKEEADYHYLPQWDLTSHEGGLIPQHVFKLSRMDRLKAFLSDRGFDISDLRHANETIRFMDWRDRYRHGLRAMANAYYQDDLINFGYD